ncbi:type II toxin-antitoxin system HipA family toxin [Pseudoduganella ginsengisoli]|uniref:Type II toxin-antitoxin system HipA family toxin n=1 Tax=Pseudoduganella ginsengisoli TaxID=1462440 RepID=A0A6L6PZR8_9BURK|nr:HipA domain-containing protein [Pseudoduganella ginsengisoli]MTW03067.1 type II toxin-antitoxin system HipA family toxin [Pseudoduganella ginsengisoli]
MATHTRKPPATTQVELDVFLGAAEHAVGKLVYVRNGPREFSQFAYREDWLTDTRYFDISPDLTKTAGYQVRKAPTKDDSTFFFALADTEPDTWGRRVIARAHAKERQKNSSLGPLTELDYLCAVDDYSRIGALRLRDARKRYLRNIEAGQRTTPPLLELEHMMTASRAVELSKESSEDLKYLLGKATSLGGMRPKCSILDEDGALALGKFPSVKDERSVTRGEVLALRLASLAGIDAASARVVMVHSEPVAVIRRFDRTAEQARIPYISGTTLLQARRTDEHAYTEVVDAMRSKSLAFKDDAQQLWRRMVFNHLITNVDDHLHNIGFLYSGANLWRLAPAFDLNPFPDKERESKTWLSEDSGPVTSVDELLKQAARFELSVDDAKRVMAQVVSAVEHWREVALSPGVGMAALELESFAPAFEHAELERARDRLA